MSTWSQDPLPIVALLSLLAFLSRIPQVRRWFRGSSPRARKRSLT